ncbi:MAG: T9SS type A sorting domain-containing protein [Bacteroidota bacterium]|nr:T9SS type A sorting domain-containing protein [Bacteroidota bacterium]
MKKTLLKISIGILFLLAAGAQNIHAQWASNGPFGGPINALDTLGSNLFAGTSNGVFKSADNGLNWTNSNNGLERKAIAALAVSGTNLLAAAYDDGVYFSSNNGTTWTIRNTGLSNFAFSALHSDQHGVFAATADGVYFSSDEGLGWTFANTGIPSTYSIYSFATMGDTIYAGSYGAGLYWSNNNGNTWNSHPDISSSSFVYSLASYGNDLFAGTSNGIFRSVDRGLSWTLSNTGFPSGMWAKAIAAKPGYLFAGTYSEGVFVSTDNGNSWSAVNTGIPDQPFPTGLPHNYPSVYDMAIVGNNIVVGTVDGNYMSSTNGTNWTWSNGGLFAADITSTAADGSFLFAGTERNGVFMSSDNGLNWIRVNNGLTSFDIESVAIHGSSVLVATMNENVFRSDDNGSTWVPASTGLINDAIFLESDDSLALAITGGSFSGPGGLFSTLDAITWTEIPTAVTGPLSTVTFKESRIFVGTVTGGLYYTDDNGVVWNSISSGLPAVKITDILYSGTLLYAGTEGQGVFLSTDNGNSWSASNTGIGNLTITGLEESSSILFVSTYGGGIYQSNNSGASWMTFNSGLDNLYVRNITSSIAGLHAGTDSGVYSTTFETWITTNSKELDIALYPNPTTGRFYFTISQKQKVKITVNSSGGELLYQFEGFPEPNQSMDLSGFSSGVYFLHLHSETGSIQKKIILQ